MNNLAGSDIYLPARSTWANLGFSHIQDANTGKPAGFSTWPLTLDRKQNVRWDSAQSYLWPIVDERKNLSVFQKTVVQKITWESDLSYQNQDVKARGVTFLGSDGKEKTVCANKEVILSAGSLKSPPLLEKSGVGNPR